ncbi:MAG: hypothetical protein IJ494_02970 [Bacteroides sp.]|nr:hypothetical protein [Bacteroides sp.]
MNKNFIFSLFTMLLLLAGCDYNEEHFPGFDDVTREDVVRFEGEFTGTYPSDGYFTDKSALEAAVADMLEDMYPYCNEGSSAKVSVLFGDITKGFQTLSADETYTLTDADYETMGTAKGEPGEYHNLSYKHDVDTYLTTFLNEKYKDLAVGKLVEIGYKYYSNYVTSELTKTYKRTTDSWEEVVIEYVADKNYELVKEDYDSMGTESGTPGRYDNFDSNMNIPFYIGIFLKEKFPYTEEGTTYEVSYKYYENKVTTTQTIIMKYDGSKWTEFDPYADILTVSTKIAEMSFDGESWTLGRLLGGSKTITLGYDDYYALVEWVLDNKLAYKDSRYDNSEYYFGASYFYQNINNNYNTWRNIYNVDGEYDGLTDEQLQSVMDERLVWGLTNIILPLHVTTPDSGISYQIVYTLYGGRGSGNYAMTFMYNEEIAAYELVAGPLAQ